MQLRPYQQRTVSAVCEHWNQGAQAICLVAPTGSGKTLMGQSLLRPDERVLWIAHRRELVDQASTRLRAAFGRENVGTVMPGAIENPNARIQVGTVQTLIERPAGAPPDVIVLDEAHHFIAETWRGVLAVYPQARVVGLTATPERANSGEALGDIFSHMVVSASYSELLALGHLVPSRVYQPDAYLGSDIALDPVEAWIQYSEGDLTFAFEPRMQLAAELAARFRSRGIRADTVSADTPTLLRDTRLARLRSGQLRVLTNVYALTEGVDVPELRVVLLARSFDFVGGYIQTVGRALRAAEGKRDAIIIDLCGATIRHGLPGQDREYSLSGKPISTAAEREAIEFSRAAFSREVTGTGLHMAAPGALATDTQPSPVRTAADVRAEKVREISDRVTRRQGRSVGDTIARMQEKMR